MHLRVLVLGLMLLSSPAFAQDEPSPGHSNIDLMRACQSRGQFYNFASESNQDAEFYGGFDLLMCLEYLGAVADTNAVVESLLGRGVFCFPEKGISSEQQARVFIKWAEANPESLHKHRRSGVVIAFAEAFPCN